MRRVALLAALLAAGGSGAAAQEPGLPPVVTAGLDAYRAAGPDSAIAAWFAGAPFDAPETRATMRSAFATMEARAGRLVGYDVVRVRPLGTHVRRIYAVLHFERSPGYLFLDAYRSPRGWVLQHINFNGEAREVFPTELLRR